MFPFCSHVVNPARLRFPPPWPVRRTDADTFVVADANGIPLAYVPCRDDLQGICYAHSRLTSDEARRIANGIARLPEFMMPRKEFYPRGGGDFRWRASCSTTLRSTTISSGSIGLSSRRFVA